MTVKPAAPWAAGQASAVRRGTWSPPSNLWVARKASRDHCQRAAPAHPGGLRSIAISSAGETDRPQGQPRHDHAAALALFLASTRR